MQHMGQVVHKTRPLAITHIHAYKQLYSYIGMAVYA